LLFLLVLAFMLWLGNSHALLWSFGLSYTLGKLGVVMAFHCLFLCWLAGSRVGFRYWAWLCGAMAGAIIASLSWGSGILTWPILVLLAWGLGLSRTAKLALLLIGASFIAIYLDHLLHFTRPAFWLNLLKLVPRDT